MINNEIKTGLQNIINSHTHILLESARQARQVRQIGQTATLSCIVRPLLLPFHFLFFRALKDKPRMTNFNRLQWSTSGLAHAPNEPSLLSPQNPATKTFISPHRAWREQQAAINILLDQQDDIIFAYLRFARSLNRNIYYFSGHGSLSSDQILAVCALRDCSDNEIKAWLEQARKLCETAGLALKLQELTPPN